MTRQVSVALFCALTGNAAGQTELRYEARHFDPSHNAGWTTNLIALPGDRIEVRAVVSTPNPAAIGLSQVIYQPIVAGWGAADVLLTNSSLGLSGAGYRPDGVGPYGTMFTTPPSYVQDQPGVYGRISPFGGGITTTSSYLRGHTHAIGGQTYLRIAQNHVTNWIGVGPTSGTAQSNNFNGGGGVLSYQPHLGPEPPRDTRYPPPSLGTQNIVTFKFSFVAGSISDSHSLVITTPPEGIGGHYVSGIFVRDAMWFAGTSEIVGSIHESVSVVDATISVPAAPSLAAPFALIVMGGRRRRAACAYPEGASS